MLLLYDAIFGYISCLLLSFGESIDTTEKEPAVQRCRGYGLFKRYIRTVVQVLKRFGLKHYYDWHPVPIKLI